VLSHGLVWILISCRLRRYLCLWKVPSCWIFSYCQGSSFRTLDGPPYLTHFLSQAWYLANLQIAIPVTVVAGLVVLLLVWGIIRGSYISAIVIRSPLTDCDYFYFYLSLIGVRRCCGGKKHPSYLISNDRSGKHTLSWSRLV
jgi:hypothetical protein